MTSALSRIHKVRERRLYQAAALVEVKRRSLEIAKEDLNVRDHALRTVDDLSTQVAEWLVNRDSDPALRITALAKMEALCTDHANASKTWHTAAAAVDDAAGELRQARLTLARAHARLNAMENLNYTFLVRAIKRREHLAETDQDYRLLTRKLEV